MGIFGTRKKEKEPEIMDEHVRELVDNLKRDLSPLYGGILTIEIYHPEKKKYEHWDCPTVTLVNRIPRGFFGANPEIRDIFSINDGRTGYNYTAAYYRDEEVKGIIERHLEDYKKISGRGFVLEKYSE
ncbi:hypothetical protein HYT25_00475 [Candidatus Pacearchaeota archaeon]|nr:hypothetical protein [Candidatus Pacearchaeota archaeon]